MSVTESSSESEGLTASRTRSRIVGLSIPATTWCSCAGATREINESSLSNSSLSLSNSYLETEFPAFPGPPAMEDRGAHALPPDLIELLQEMTDRLHAHEQHIDRAPRASGLQPPVFRGSPTDDFDEWLQKFQRYAIFNRWTPEQQLNGFMMFLGGSALRVCQRQTPEVRGNLEALEQALREVYVSPHQQFLRRQELNNRTQGPLESLENYLDDVDARAARLQLTDAETMQCFVQGLRQDLKEHVILLLPQTYAAAVDAARLKNSLARSPTSISADQASRTLSSSNLEASQATRTSTAGSSPESQYVTRQEFMKWQYQVQTAPQNYAPVGPMPLPANSYNLRNRRTTDVRPICNNCNRVGHIASRCFANQARPSFAPSRFNMAQSGYPQRQLDYNQRNTFSNRQAQYQPRQYITIKGMLKIPVLI